MTLDEEERLQKMGHLNKVAENLQSDTLEERLYLQLNTWKKIAGFFTLAFFGFFVVVTLAVTFPFDGADDVVGITFLAVMIGSVVTWGVQRKRSTRIQREYIRRQYFLSLSTMEGEGETVLEKFMDLAINVFPPLKQRAKKYGFSKEWWLEDTKKKGEIKYDISVKVSFGLVSGWFLVKRFDKAVTFDDIKNLYIKDASERKRENILRIVVIAKDYDKSFFTDEFEEQMKDLLFNTARKSSTKKTEKYVNELKMKGQYENTRQSRLESPDRDPMDLLIEKESGFSPLWLDS